MLERIGPPPPTYICCKLHICTFMRISSYTNIGSFCEIDTLVCSASSLERARSAYMTHIFSSLLEKTSENSKPCRGACAALAALAVHTKSTEYHTIRRTRRGNTILIVVMMEASHLYKTSIQLIRRWARFKSSRSTKTPLERRPKRQLQLVKRMQRADWNPWNRHPSPNQISWPTQLRAFSIDLHRSTDKRF